MVKHNTKSANYKITTEQLNAFIDLDTTDVKKEGSFDSRIFLGILSVKIHHPSQNTGFAYIWE